MLHSQFRSSSTLLILGLALTACSNAPGTHTTRPGASSAQQDPASGTGASTGTPPTGTPSSGGAPGVVPNVSVAAADLAKARARRLTAQEIQNSVRDVFFATEPLAVPPLVEGNAKGFALYDDYAVTLDFYTALQAFSESVSAVVAPRLLSSNCGSGAAACVGDIIASYGLRLYRRPVTPDETAHLTKAFNEASAIGTPEQALSVVLQALLMSPDFLYRTELGGPRTVNAVVALTGYERASALSYFLWQSAPDEALLAAAETGTLNNAQGLESELGRVLNDARAKPVLRNFFMVWLGIHPEEVSKNSALFTPALQASMRTGAEHFVDELLWSASSDIKELFVSAVPAGNPNERAGILTDPSFIVSHTPSDSFSPIHLGVTLRRDVLCQELPPPPPLVPEAPQDPNLSIRQKFEMHKSNSGCASCHELIDPLGFPFEVYDVLGQYQTSDRGFPVNGAGTITGTDVDGPVMGAVELSQRLSMSTTVKSCYVASVLQYLLGRSVQVPHQRTHVDQQTIDSFLSGSFSTGNMLAVMKSAMLSDPAYLRDATDLPL